jgi:hypothetical protein
VVDSDHTNLAWLDRWTKIRSRPELIETSAERVRITGIVMMWGSA